MSKHRYKRREVADGHYFQMHEWLMKSAAWRHASVYERSLYLELKRRYNGRNNGDISLSQREAITLLGCSNTAVEKAFKGLVDKRFIRVQRAGGFGWKVDGERRAGGRATRWLLTELPQDLPVRVLSGGTKDFMQWRPEEKSAARSERADCPSTAGHSENMARSERAIKSGVPAHAGR